MVTLFDEHYTIDKRYTTTNMVSTSSRVGSRIESNAHLL